MRLVGLLALAGALGGCAGGSKDYDKAVAENTELRGQIATLQQSLDDCEGRYAALEGQSKAGQDLKIPGASTRTGPNGELIVDIAGDVLFDPGSTALKSGSKQTLDSVASVIKAKYPQNTVRVEGYTDGDPIKKSKWETNERLSGERAMSVEKYLVSKGVDNNQVYFAGFGPARAQTSKNKSRRVEIVILGPGT
jgi:outer membrane protein OmpA-like peptidoglycan-associated protein